MPKTTTKEDKKAAVKADAPEKKKRTKKEPKDENKPKRALSAYMFFVTDYRGRIIEENPDVSFGEVGKLLGAKWKELGPAEKKPYEAKAEEDKKRAAKDKAAYTGGAGASTSKKPAATKKAAKPPPAEDDDDEEEDDEEDDE